MTAILDASALIALLAGEPGADKVAGILVDAEISAVNISEVAAKLTERGVPMDEVRALLDDLPIRVMDFDREQAFVAANFRLATRSQGLSLGDRACLGLGRVRASVVYTADNAWDKLDVGVEIRFIR